MKLRTIVKIALTTSIVLLCTGFAMYSFFKISAAENRKDFNLYTLIPPSATVVFDTDNLSGFIQDVNDLESSRNNQFLHISKLFSLLKLNLYSVLEETPHGLSRQMNKAILSFHEPDNDRNQIFYCSLGEGDREQVEVFIRQYLSSEYPYKTFDYKGENIRIYPMEGGDFMACYLTSDFMVVSYQKKLIEKVIDTYKSGRSLVKDSLFARSILPKKGPVAATVYVRMQPVRMGVATDTLSYDAAIGGWTEFDLKLKGERIYLSGVNNHVDTCLTLTNVIRRQSPVSGFPGNLLPSTTLFLTKYSIGDWDSLLKFAEKQPVAKQNSSVYALQRDKEFLHYLKRHIKGELTTCTFSRKDTSEVPAVVVSMSIDDAVEAEKQLYALIKAIPKEEGLPRMPRITFCYTSTRAYGVYPLPENRLLTQLTGVRTPDLYNYSAFYGGQLLLASDVDALKQYIYQLDKGQVLEETAVYQAGIDGLDNPYHWMLWADLSEVFRLRDNYTRLLPDYFFRNEDFFRNFILSIQFLVVGEAVHPNINLIYKGS